MKLLFIVYSLFDDANGISKKIQAQVKALQKASLKVDLCHHMIIGGVRYWAVNGIPIAKVGSGRTAMIKHFTQFSPILKYVKQHEIDCVYMRYAHNATPFMLRALNSIKKQGVNIVMEIPTFPYDGEYANKKGISRLIHRLERYSRKKLKKNCSKIITFSNHERIFGIPTIRLSNAVDLSDIPLRKDVKAHDGFKLLGVANINFWHGFDRLIAGLGNYYRSPHSDIVRFTIVGNGEPFISQLKMQAEQEGVADFVEFKGSMSGKELDIEFADADLCIGCLACHRKNIDEVKSLKNVEYAARGMVMIYSEKNNDFDGKPYVIKVPDDESAIDIKYLLNESAKINISAECIRNSVRHLSWSEQMKKVSDWLLS